MFRLATYADFFMITDWQQTTQMWHEVIPVMNIGLDSQSLVNSVPRNRKHVRHILDLCTGSGVQSIAALTYVHVYMPFSS